MQQRGLLRLVRTRRILKQTTRRIGPVCRLGPLVIHEKAHIQALGAEHVAAEHEGGDEGVVVFAVEEVAEIDVLGAVGVVAAAGAGPGGEGLVGALHEVGGGGRVGWWAGLGVGGWGGGGEEGEEEGEEGESGVHDEGGFVGNCVGGESGFRISDSRKREQV
ncbi:hypothetical protein BDR22DRAFT_919914 [Usnea florida]